MNEPAHDQTEIETPAFVQFTNAESPSVLTEEETDDEKYVNLHVHFEELERKRYVMDNLSVDQPQIFSLAMAQFLEIKPHEQMLQGYHPTHTDLLHYDLTTAVRSRAWNAADQEGFTVLFSV